MRRGPRGRTREVNMSSAVAVTVMLTSKAFSEGSPIPRQYTCEGEETAPPLEWSGLPAGTKSLALIVDDPDAPDPKAPKRTWVHWIVFNLPGKPGELAQGVKALPDGARFGVNDNKRAEYGGPCPPVGRHRYFHKIYALDTVLELERPTKA